MPWWCSHEDCLWQVQSFSNEQRLEDHVQSIHQDTTIVKSNDPVSVVVLALIGLPGSGKSTLARTMQDVGNTPTPANPTTTVVPKPACVVWVLSVDDYLYDPAIHLNNRTIRQAQPPPLGETWKQQRGGVLDRLQLWLENLNTCQHHEHQQPKGTPPPPTPSSPLDYHACICGTKHLVIVDDNMYYTSMRYQVYQIVRQFGCGFAQVMLNCTEAIAVQRDGLRSLSVGQSTIARMVSRLEPPDSTQNKWERHSCILDSAGLDVVEVLAKVNSVVEAARKDPAHPVQLVDEQAIERARQQTLKNVRHQFDVASRKTLGSAMTKFSNCCGSKAATSEFAKRVNLIRKSMLVKLKEVSVVPSNTELLEELSSRITTVSFDLLHN
eukprot:m.118244 g.118244  ORF g.118244 m.118244 type:complete len:381 (-) comp28645_c0_seq2:48-1190(-)